MKKIISIFAVLSMSLLFIAGCSQNNNTDETAISTFSGVVFEVADSSILVSVDQDFRSITGSDLAWVTIPVPSDGYEDDIVIDFVSGDVVLISFDGEIMESFPVQIMGVYSIEILRHAIMLEEEIDIYSQIENEFFTVPWEEPQMLDVVPLTFNEAQAVISATPLRNDNELSELSALQTAEIFPALEVMPRAFAQFGADGNIVGVTAYSGELTIGIGEGQGCTLSAYGYEEPPETTLVYGVFVTAFYADIDHEAGIFFKATFQIEGIPYCINLWNPDLFAGKEILNTTVSQLILSRPDYVLSLSKSETAHPTVFIERMIDTNLGFNILHEVNYNDAFYEIRGFRFDGEGERLVIWANAPIYNLSLISIEIDAYDDELIFIVEDIVFTLDVLDSASASALVIDSYYGMGTFPRSGISFEDEFGTKRYYMISVSGYDGSFNLLEFEPYSR